MQNIQLPASIYTTRANQTTFVVKSSL